MSSAIYVGIFEGHWDPAVAVVQEGRLVAFAEEERFVRWKHAPRLYPSRALRWCLQQADVAPEKVEAIAVNWNLPAYTDSRMREFFLQMAERYTIDENTRRWQQSVLSYFHAERTRSRHEYHWRKLFGAVRLPPVHAVPHHLTHALHAYLQSPFSEALCLTMDGSGDQHCTVVWECQGEQVQPLKEICMPHSLGWYYAAFTEYLGFQAYDGEYKLMALAAYGRPEASLRAKVGRVLSVAEDGCEYRLDGRFIHHGRHSWSERFTDDLVELLGRPPRLADEPPTPWHEDLAFEVQRGLEEAVARLVAWGVGRVGQRSVCLGGGVALNVKLNARVFGLPGVRDVFAQPLANDGGAAAGAALAACWQLSGVRPERLVSLALGPAESEDSLRATLDNCHLAYETPEDPVEFTACALTEGQVVGWFQGRMEAGPRALGQRSILADPRRSEARDRVNAAIKYREPWRPFCPSLPAENAPTYLRRFTDGLFMNLAFEATDRLRREAPAVVHVDGTARAHLVRAELQPLFHSLLRAFGRRTGVPVLLNTSFNIKGEPIVCSASDALRTFFSTGLDLLVCGPFVLRKRPPAYTL